MNVSIHALENAQHALETARARLERKSKAQSEARASSERWSAKARALGEEIAGLHREIQGHTETVVGLGGKA